MKILKRNYLPETIEIKGETYHRNNLATRGYQKSGTSLNLISAAFRKDERKAVLIEVLSKNLKGKQDLHGKPYQLTKWIFTTEKNSI